MVTKTGDNLIITIICEYLPHNNWMTFASWYSITKYLPDAKCNILCKRGLNKLNLYDWTHKCKVPMNYTNNLESFDFNKTNLYHKVINCSVMAIDVWNKDFVGPYNVKSNIDCTFVDYFDQCGNFYGNDWLNKIIPPFSYVDSFYSEDLNLNESKIFKMWNKCKSVFNFLK